MTHPFFTKQFVKNFTNPSQEGLAMRTRVKVNYGEWQVFSSLASAGFYIGKVIANRLGYFIGFDNKPANFRDHVVIHGTTCIEVKPVDLTILLYVEVEDKPDYWREPTWSELADFMHCVENAYWQYAYKTYYEVKEQKEEKLKTVANILNTIKASGLSVDEFIKLAKETDFVKNFTNHRRD